MNDVSHHDRFMVTLVAAADWTEFLICQSITLLAVTDIRLGLRDRASQTRHLLLRHIDDMKCQSLC